MAKIDFYYKGKKVNEDIANWRDLEIEVAFEDDGDEPRLRSGSLEFVGDLAKQVNNHAVGGLYGDVGIFEAPNFRIEACGNNTQLFNGGINLAECVTTFECDKVVAPLRHNQVDYFRDRASSFGFAYLASLPFGTPGHIDASYIQVPYVNNNIPDGINIMVACISLFMMLKEFEEILEKTVSVVAELNGDLSMTIASTANPITLNVGVGMAIGRIIVDILRITFYILYLLFIIKALLTLLQMVFDNIIQPVKHKRGMRVHDLMSKGAEYMGLQFISSLYQGFGPNGDDVIVPRKIALNNFPTKLQDIFGRKKIKSKDHDEYNNPKAVGYPDWTFAQLILAEEQRLDAEARVIGNYLYFERKDFFKKQAFYTLPNIKGQNADPHGTNACEIAGTYRVAYTLDEQDTNTYDQYEGTSCQMTLVPNYIQNKRNVLLKNLTEIILPYSLAKRKEILTAVEEVFETLYYVVGKIHDGIAGFINSIINIINIIIKFINLIPGVNGNIPSIGTIDPFPPNPFSGRIGMMLLSNDFIGVPKILKIDSLPVTGTNNVFKLHPNNAFLTSARYLIDNNHYTNFGIRTKNSFGVVKDDHNQWYTYENKEIPLCCNDYISLLNNNHFKTYDQKEAKLLSLIWNPYKEMAKITYRVKQKYTINLSNTYIIDGQQ